MGRRKIAIQAFLDTLNGDIRNNSTSPDRRVMNRLRSRVQEGGKKVRDYKEMYQVYINDLSGQQRLIGLQSMSVDLDLFEAYLSQMDIKLDQVEEKLPTLTTTVGSGVSAQTTQSVHRPNRTFLKRSKFKIQRL